MHHWFVSSVGELGWAPCLFSIPDTTAQSSSICSGDSGQPSTRAGFASRRLLTACLHPAPFFLGRKPKGAADSHPRRVLASLWWKGSFRQPPCGWPRYPPGKAVLKASPLGAHCPHSPFLGASSQTTFNRRKINPHRNGGNRLIFTNFVLFCVLGSETQDFPNQVK